VHIVTFNKRRISEVEEICLLDYKVRPRDYSKEDIAMTLDISEKSLADRQVQKTFSNNFYD
jgi:hypothetical protein